jgi:pentatricopeptide repeat protein
MFEGMPMQDTVSWNAMISAYASRGHPEDSLECFLKMLGAGIHAIDRVTVMCALNACASLGSLAHGLSIHSLAAKTGLDCVENAVIDMYGKSGDVESCFAAFKRMQRGDDDNDDDGDDRMSWNSMISCYAQSGLGIEAIELFMSQFGNRDAKLGIVASVGVISACDHAGLVDEGLWLFGEMYGRIGLCADISCAPEHHVCMIDMLGRAGRMGRALAYVDQMPFQPLANAWRSLLGACRIHGDVTKGEEAARASMELEPENEAACLLLYNTYFATRERKEEEGGGGGHVA